MLTKLTCEQRFIFVNICSLIVWISWWREHGDKPSCTICLDLSWEEGGTYRSFPSQMTTAALSPVLYCLHPLSETYATNLSFLSYWTTRHWLLFFLSISKTLTFCHSSFHIKEWQLHDTFLVVKAEVSIYWEQDFHVLCRGSALSHRCYAVPSALQLAQGSFALLCYLHDPDCLNALF